MVFSSLYFYFTSMDASAELGWLAFSQGQNYSVFILKFHALKCCALKRIMLYFHSPPGYWSVAYHIYPDPNIVQPCARRTHVKDCNSYGSQSRATNLPRRNKTTVSQHIRRSSHLASTAFPLAPRRLRRRCIDVGGCWASMSCLSAFCLSLLPLSCFSVCYSVPAGGITKWIRSQRTA